MTIIIQQANTDHAAAIASIKARVWPDEATDEAQIVAALSADSHVTHIACIDDGVIGFVDGFLTTAADGRRRWEVDLLAVHPDWRGQQLGQRLITATTHIARQRNVSLARALVQINNLPSQRAFQRCSYHSDHHSYTLVVSAATSTQGETTIENAHLVPVTTMNYGGLWLEGDLTAENLAAAQIERARRNAPVIGALLPGGAIGALKAAEALGYTLISRFHWWLYQ